MDSKFWVIVTMLIAAALLPACGGSGTGPSQYCTDKGNELSFVETPEGTMGVCIFSDDSVCEERAFYYGMCAPGQNMPVTENPSEGQTGVGIANPASVNCIEKGGTLVIVQDKDSNEYGLCRLASDKICEEWAFFRGECSP